MFQALLAHLQEALHKWLLEYCVCCASWPPEGEQVMLETLIFNKLIKSA
jgi:hypothetical protein